MKADIVNTTHCLLEAFLCLYIFREFMKMWISRRDYWKEIDSYRNLLIIVLVFVTLNKKHLDIGSTDDMASLQRWNYHLASLSCLLTWIEMMYLMGRVPRFGKYIQMFWFVQNRNIIHTGCIFISGLLLFKCLNFLPLTYG